MRILLRLYLILCALLRALHRSGGLQQTVIVVLLLMAISVGSYAEQRQYTPEPPAQIVTEEQTPPSILLGQVVESRAIASDYGSIAILRTAEPVKIIPPLRRTPQKPVHP